MTVHSVVDAWYARALFSAYAREYDGDYILKLFSKSGYCLKKIQRISQLTRATNYKDRMIKNSKV